MVPLIGYVAVIVLANWAIQQFGVVPVGFGLVAPAGVYFAGLAFTFRDLVQEQLGRAWTFGAILIGAALSAVISPQFALASGVAFLISELADFLVYTPLRTRHWLGAVLLEAGRAAEAEVVYWEDLRRNRENGWALFGLQQALERQGKTDDATLAQERFARAWARADITLTSSRY